MKPKIVHIITGLNNGGAEASLYKLVRFAVKKKQKITVISLLSEGIYGQKIRDLGIDLYCLNLSRRPQNFFFLLPQVLKKEKPKIIQGWMYHGNILAFFSRLFYYPKAKLCWSIRHSLHAISDEKFITGWLIRLGAWLSNYVDIVLFNSDISMRQHVVLGYSRENSVLIPNGFDVEKYYPCTNKRNVILTELAISGSSKIIGHIARYHPDKGHEIFLSAILPILAENKKVHILMAGKSVDYDNSRLASRVPANLISQVHLLGDRHDVPELMATIDVFVQSSRTEAFPNALGEAMSAGAACLATDVGDSLLMLGSKELVVERSDVDAMREKIMKLLSSPEVCKRQGQVARSRIVKFYPISKMLSDYERVYNQLSRSNKISEDLN